VSHRRKSKKKTINCDSPCAAGGPGGTDTAVSKSVDFFPLRGDNPQETGNYPLVFFVPEAMQSYVNLTHLTGPRVSQPPEDMTSTILDAAATSSSQI
jgi:hypothetical protein